MPETADGRLGTTDGAALTPSLGAIWRAGAILRVKSSCLHRRTGSSVSGKHPARVGAGRSLSWDVSIQPTAVLNRNTSPKGVPYLGKVSTTSMATNTATVPAKTNSSGFTLESFLAAAGKKYGAGAAFRLGENKKMKVDVLSTGSIAIDVALGVGGLARGRIVEIYGPESSGKTTVCLSVIAQAQRNGGKCAFIDVEHALDPKYARTVGCNVDELVVAQPDDGESALGLAEDCVKSGLFEVIVIDSVAALVTKKELEGDMGDTTVGLQARLMSSAMRRLTAVVSKSRCIVLFTNQLREKIGVMHGSPETTPGGRALKFFASVRIDIRRIGKIDSKDEITGNRTKVKIVKNKLAAPFKEAEFDIMYAEGISNAGSVLDLGIEAKILEQKGAWISYKGSLIGQGREAARKFLIETPAISQEIEAAIKAKNNEGAVLVEVTAPVAPAVLEPAQAELLEETGS